MGSQRKRLSPKELEALRAIVIGLQSLSDYAPTNELCSVATLRELVAKLARAEEAEISAKRIFEVAREQAIEAARILYAAVLEVKAQVIAQYGSDSLVLHAVGLKQKSERKRYTRRETGDAR